MPPACDTGRVGVAVSGGSDSLATLLLLAQSRQVAAVTVDHGLRPEAAQEASFVSALCARHAIPHEVLQWDGPAPTGNLMDQARRARLRLIAGWAKQNGIGHVALGHTLDDQAETFLMRLARRAGPEGLSGMRQRFEFDAVMFHRPVLAHARSDLRAYLAAQGQVWVDDPSNDNRAYDRVKARHAMQALGPMGLDAAAISHVIGHIKQSEAALNGILAQFVTDHVETPLGDVVIAQSGFSRLDHELRRRMMNAALCWVSGAEYVPRAAKVEGLLSVLTQPGVRTVHGCHIASNDTEIRITRELRPVAQMQTAYEPGAVWDRWQVDGPALPHATIRALGADGLLQCPEWRQAQIPRVSLLASPSVWCGAQLIFAPLAGVNTGWNTTLVQVSLLSSLFRR
ncbi:tRNA lysidine(34) synthetase TilS [Thioclava sp. SK-1]|nr:tRNA lysidine(34) synthetase TilS [Thioclava sp. SK-1]